MKKQRINVLGEEYTLITDATIEDYPILKNNDGYCDWTIKHCIIGETTPTDRTVKNLNECTKKTIRHELIHAMFFESGLFDNSYDELVVDWVASQFPKMLKIFQEADAL